VLSGAATWAGPIVLATSTVHISGYGGTLTISGPITDNGNNTAVHFYGERSF